MTAWKEGLSEELAVSPAFKDIGDDINDLAQNYLDAQTHLGTSIRIPSQEASDDDVTAFHNKLIAKVPGLIPTPDKEQPGTIDIFLKALGKPEAADDYEVPAPEGIIATDQQINLIKKTAHEVGMTQDQVTGFLTKMYEQELDQATVHEADLQTEMINLKKEWGVTFDKKMESLTNNLLLSEAPEGLTASIKAQKIDGATVKWLDTLFGKLGDTTVLDPDPTLDAGDIVPEEAAERANEVRAKLMKGDISPTSKEYQNLLTKLLKYEKMANPDASSDFNDLRAGVRTN